MIASPVQDLPRVQKPERSSITKLSFADLIAPTTVEDFFAQFWETTFLHVRHESDRFSDYFSLDDIEPWMHSTRDGSVFVIQPAGEEVRLDIHKASSVSPQAISQNFKNGLAQIFKKLVDWPALQSLVKHLGGVFHADVQVNAFLTPAGARPHPTYTSNDEILVLQLEGEEVWRLHEFDLLQLDLSQKQHLDFPRAWQDRHQTPVLSEFRLHPGDVLYIPRGMPHLCKSPHETGLHLRIYISPLFWADFLKFAVEQAALHSQPLRRSLPPGFMEDAEKIEQMRDAFTNVMDVLRQVSFDQVLSAVKRNRVDAQGFPPNSIAFDDKSDAQHLTVSSRVERRPDVLCTAEEVLDESGTHKSSIFFGDHRVNGPRALLPAMKFICEHSSFRVSEIPGLNEKSQQVLTRRLISEGLLQLLPEP